MYSTTITWPPASEATFSRDSIQGVAGSMSSVNLAARAGRWSADNWKKAFLGWLVLAVVALLVGMAAGHKQIADSETASGDAAKAQRTLEQAGFKAPATESVLIQSARDTA